MFEAGPWQPVAGPAALSAVPSVVQARDGPYVCDGDQYDNFEIEAG